MCSESVSPDGLALFSVMSLISLMTPGRKEHGLLATAQSFGKNLGVILGSTSILKLLEAFSDTPGEQMSPIRKSIRMYATEAMII